VVKKAENKRKSNRLLPIFGLILALAFALVAFLLYPIVVDFLVRQGVSFGTLTPLMRDLLIGGALWFAMFGVAMFLVALAVGSHEDDRIAADYYQRASKRKKIQKQEEELKRRRRLEMRRTDSRTTRK
jgi:hypothetical protein